MLWSWSMIYYWLSSLWVVVRDERGLFLPIYPPRGMRSSTFLQGLIKFCNKYMSYLWLNVSPWIIHTYLFAICYPLQHHALPFLTSRCGANFAGASKPCDMIRSITHKTPYIFLKTATIPTYYGISIAIWDIFPCNFPPFRLLWHAPSLSYCFAWSCSWHRICGKAIIHNSFIHVTLDSFTSRYTAGGIHIESYFVLSIEL